MGLFSLCFILRELDSVLPEIRLGAISPTKRERNAGFGGRMEFEDSCSVIDKLQVRCMNSERSWYRNIKFWFEKKDELHRSQLRFERLLDMI